MGIILIALRPDAHHLQHIHSLLFCLLFGAVLMQADHFTDLITDGNHGIQRRHGILEDHADLFPSVFPHLFFKLCLLRLRCILRQYDLLTVQFDAALHDMTGRNRQKSHKCQRYRCLSRSCLSHKPQHIPLFDLKGNAVHRLHNTVISLIMDNKIIYFHHRNIFFPVFFHPSSSLFQPRIQRIPQTVSQEIKS